MTSLHRETDWAEVDVSPSEESHFAVISRTQTAPDANGVSVITEIRYNERGQKVKTTRKVRTVKTIVQENRRVVERRKWAKFGACEGKVGLEPGVTGFGEPVTFNPTLGKVRKEVQEEEQEENTIISLIRQNMAKIALKGLSSEGAAERDRDRERDASSSSQAGGLSSGAANRYVAPRSRPGAAGGSGGGFNDRGPSDDNSTLRVSNLPEEVSEQELRDLFMEHGRIHRFFLAKDRETRASKGFAFISFYNRSDAERAMNKLNGYGLEHLILHIEWAKPSANPR